MAGMRWQRLLLVLLVVAAAGWQLIGLMLMPGQAQAAAQAPMSDGCSGCNHMDGLSCPVMLCALQPALLSSPLPVRDREPGKITFAFADEHAREHHPGVPRPPPRTLLLRR